MAAASAKRRRRLTTLGAVLAAAVVVVVVAVIVSSGGGGNDKPQQGITLGRPDAKVTVVEFADLQCPVCKEFSQQVLPRIVQDHVRSGQAKIELRLVNILDRGGVTDSARMAAVGHGAQQQDKLWNFAELQYFNQGEEETGYATDTYIRRIAAGVRGLDVGQAFAARSTPAAAQALRDANALFQRYGATGTPTILVGPTGGTLRRLDSFDADSVSSAIAKARS
jgi:protein-disulfide isomerase